MRNLLWLALLSLFVATQLPAITIGYQVTANGGVSYTYNYTLTGPFFANDFIYVDFPAFTDTNLCCATPGGDWMSQAVPSIAGSPAEYYLQAQVTNPSLAGPFSVKFDYSGPSSPGPGSQVFHYYHYDSQTGGYSGETQMGSTFLIQGGGDPPAVPEPATVGLSGAALLAMAVCSAVSRKRRESNPQA